jgi:hypothetical protein
MSMEVNKQFANLIELEEKLKKNKLNINRAHGINMNLARRSDLYTKNANFRALFIRVNKKLKELEFNFLIELGGKLIKPSWVELVKNNPPLKNAYIKKMHNTRKTNLYSTNTSYRTLFNKVNINFKMAIKNENRPNIRFRMQEGGTCWFHSIVNGLLLSKRPREILKQMSQNVITDKRRGYTMCPMRNAPRLLFWQYIKHRLDGYGGVSSAYKNVNVIRSSSVRSPRRWSRNNYEGGSLSDVYNFYKKMFPSGLFVLREYTSQNIPHSLPGYTLTHGHVIMWLAPNKEGGTLDGHAVAGYLTSSGKYKMYDSSDDSVIDYDWTVKHAERYNPRVIQIEVIAVFTKNI